MLILNSLVFFPLPEELICYLFLQQHFMYLKTVVTSPVSFPCFKISKPNFSIFPNRSCIFRSLSLLFFFFDLLQLMQYFLKGVAQSWTRSSTEPCESWIRAFEFMAKWKLTKPNCIVRGDDFLWSRASSNSIRITILPSTCCQQSFSNTTHNYLAYLENSI